MIVLVGRIGSSEHPGPFAFTGGVVRHPLAFDVGQKIPSPLSRLVATHFFEKDGCSCSSAKKQKL